MGGVFKRAAPILLLVALGAMRFTHWGAPLTADEAYMARNYADRPVAEIVTRFEAPNNHILLSLLMHAANAASPKDLFPSLRHPGPLQLLSILPAIGALLLLFLLAAEAYSERTALLAVAALGLSYWHALYSHLLRGYSLATFLLLLCVWSLLKGIKTGRGRLLVLAALAFAAFNYAVASNLFLSAGALVWLGVWAWSAEGEERRSTRAALGALAGGAALGALLYLPVWTQMAAAARPPAEAVGHLAALTGRLAPAATVFGLGVPYRLYFLALAAVGLAVSRRRPFLPWLGLSLLATPLVLSTAQGITIPFARVYIPMLPFWCVAFALGVEAVWDRLLVIRPSLASRGPLILAAVALSAPAGEVGRFLSWNRDTDVRGLVRAVAERTKESDDFILIYPEVTEEESGVRPDWGYHLFAAGLMRQLRAVEGHAPPYLLHRRTLVAARSPEEALGALTRSGLPPDVTQGLSLLSTHGGLRLYGLNLDSVLSARTASVVSAARAFLLLGSGRPEEAAALLEGAKRSAPTDRRVRYYLGLARYLAFDDRRAAEELSWVVAHDTENARAPFYYADALAGLGRREESRRWYAWYSEAANARQTGGWIFALRTSAAEQAGAPPVLPSRRAEGWAEAARAYHARGALERATAAWHATRDLRPTAEADLGLAQAYAGLQEFAAAARTLRGMPDVDAGDESRLLLAEVFYLKRRPQEARAELEAFLARRPEHAEAKALLQRVLRL